MKIVLQGRDLLKEMSTCLVQFVKGQLFTQGVIGIAENSIFFYDDNQPNSLDGDTAFYKIEHIVRIPNIEMIYFGRTKHNRETRMFRYFVLVNADEEFNTTVYYTRKERRRIKRILKLLKKEHIKFKRKNIDLAPVFEVPKNVYEKNRY